VTSIPPFPGMFLAFLPAVVLLVGCDQTPPVCDDVEAWTLNRLRELPRDCAVDADCEVVWLRPDLPAAARRSPADPWTRRATRTLSDRCLEELYEGSLDALPVAGGRIDAVCALQLVSELTAADEQAPGVLGRRCVLRGVPELPPSVAEPPPPPADPPPCDCEQDADCGPGRCIACTCLPDSPCAVACARAWGCAVEDQLNLGTRPDVCVRECERAGVRDPERYGPFLSCLLQSDRCESLDQCVIRR
jgi:hypothetical protein